MPPLARRMISRWPQTIRRTRGWRCWPRTVWCPRAPYLPFVKLVFGTEYDKTRLTEYATALAHARRVGLGKGHCPRI
jgi:hypothetical protein